MKTLLMTLLTLSFIAASCDGTDDILQIESNPIITNVNAQPVEPLSASEIDDILFMREEEKLARDVYDYLYTKWSVQSFKNIASSEQSHMDAILALINKYDLNDPASANIPGKFTNPVLQSLYDDLIKSGSISKEDAFRVGAAIEEIDILDLQKALDTNVDNKDIILVFESLTKGSRNHLRSFVKNLSTIGVSYSPQYLTQAAYDDIINAPMEQGGSNLNNIVGGK
uniref:DUF2202 domain-containing protein n=1 Tax=Fulvivirga sp. TaxID=1931237 RepID=UPI004049FCFC